MKLSTPALFGFLMFVFINGVYSQTSSPKNSGPFMPAIREGDYGHALVHSGREEIMTILIFGSSLDSLKIEARVLVDRFKKAEMPTDVVVFYEVEKNISKIFGSVFMHGNIFVLPKSKEKTFEVDILKKYTNTLAKYYYKEYTREKTPEEIREGVAKLLKEGNYFSARKLYLKLGNRMTTDDSVKIGATFLNQLFYGSKNDEISQKCDEARKWIEPIANREHPQGLYQMGRLILIESTLPDRKEKSSRTLALLRIVLACDLKVQEACELKEKLTK